MNDRIPIRKFDLWIFSEISTNWLFASTGRARGASFLNYPLDYAVPARCMTAEIATKPSTTLDSYQFETETP